MFCCSVAAVILSQLYAGLISLRALLCGRVTTLAEGGGSAAALFRTATAFSGNRLALALLTGAVALSVALAVGSGPPPRNGGWVPMASAFCGKALS